MATEIPLLIKSAPAAADLSSYQYRVVRLGATGFNLASSAGGFGALGILQNAPDGTSETASVMLAGLSKAWVNGAITIGMKLTINTVGQLVGSMLSTDVIVATAMEAGTNCIIQVCVYPVCGTIQQGKIREASVTITAAQLIALSATPKVLVSHTALVAAGEIAAGDALIFGEATLNIYGGTTDYDQNQNSIVKYQTAGGGATVSTTYANFFNVGTDGTLGTIKQLVTDIVPEINQDLVLTSSASPKNANGDRLCKITTHYWVFTPDVA